MNLPNVQIQRASRCPVLSPLESLVLELNCAPYAHVDVTLFLDFFFVQISTFQVRFLVENRCHHQRLIPCRIFQQKWPLRIADYLQVGCFVSCCMQDNWKHIVQKLISTSLPCTASILGAENHKKAEPCRCDGFLRILNTQLHVAQTVLVVAASARYLATKQVQPSFLFWKGCEPQATFTTSSNCKALIVHRFPGSQ